MTRFDPTKFNVEVYLEELSTYWAKSDFYGHWSNKTDEEKQAQIDRVRQNQQADLAKLVETIAERDQLNAEHNYRFGDITIDNWRNYTWTKAEWYEDTPFLLLGAKDGPITFRPDCPWDPKIYQHQTSGMACAHPLLHGVKLPLSDHGYRIASEISKRWLDSNIGNPASLDNLVAYRSQLQSFGIDCNTTYLEFQEAWYPVDLGSLYELVEVDSLQRPEPQGDEGLDYAVCQWINQVIYDPGDPAEVGIGWYWRQPKWELVICGENCD